MFHAPHAFTKEDLGVKICSHILAKCTILREKIFVSLCFSAQPFLTCSKSFVSRRLGDWESSTGNETKIPILFEFYWKQIVLLANFISTCFLCETLFAEWGFEVSWLHPILPPPHHLGCFIVQLLLLLNLPTCVCQRAFFDDKIWIDYKRMPSCKVYFSFLKKAGNLRGSNPRETTCRRKWKIRNRPISTHQCHFLPQLKACPKSAPFQFHTPSKLLSCEGGAPHVCI